MFARAMATEMATVTATIMMPTNAKNSATTTTMRTTCPGWALSVVTVAAMLVVGGGSTTATVEETATEVAEEAGDGPGGWRLCSVFYFSPIFFLTVDAAATKGRGNITVFSREASSGRMSTSLFSLMCCCWCRRRHWCPFSCCHRCRFRCCRCFCHRHCRRHPIFLPNPL